MERALNKNLPEVYKAAFKQLCELAGTGQDDPSDPVCTENLIRVDEVAESPKLAQ